MTPSVSDEEKKPAVQRDRAIRTDKTAQQEKSSQQTKQTEPSKSGQVEKPVTQPRVVTPAKPNEPEKPAVQTHRNTSPEKSAGTRSFSAPATQTEKATDKSRKVERSGSAIQKRKTSGKSNSTDHQSESGATENPEQR